MKVTECLQVEHVLVHRISEQAQVKEMQFNFLPGNGTINAMSYASSMGHTTSKKPLFPCKQYGNKRLMEHIEK